MGGGGFLTEKGQNAFQRAGETDKMWEDRRAMPSEDREAAAAENKGARSGASTEVKDQRPFFMNRATLSPNQLDVWESLTFLAITPHFTKWLIISANL